MEVRVKTFEELTASEVYELLRLRSEVFVVEQNCVYQDIDNKDQKALHILGLDQHELVAYTRVFGPGDYFKEASIGRVLVKQKHRSNAYGKQIMRSSIQAVSDHFNSSKIVISAQTYLVKFYKELEFTPFGSEYLEDGIPHIKMIRTQAR